MNEVDSGTVHAWVRPIEIYIAKVEPANGSSSCTGFPEQLEDDVIPLPVTRSSGYVEYSAYSVVSGSLELETALMSVAGESGIWMFASGSTQR